MACTRHSIGIVLQTPVRPRFLVARKARLTSFLVFGCGGAEWHEIGIASPYRVPRSLTVPVSSPLDLRGPAQALASVTWLARAKPTLSGRASAASRIKKGCLLRCRDQSRGLLDMWKMVPSLIPHFAVIRHVEGSGWPAVSQLRDRRR